jgi:RNase P/RNase MRP subunit POP5
VKPKKRYILMHYTGSGDLLDAIKQRYGEKFGTVDLEKTSLKIISDVGGFLILRCELDNLKHLLETLASMDGKFVTLNMSGTLKALRSREEAIKKRFIAGNRY